MAGFLKNILVLGILGGMAYVLGYGVNNYIPWYFLTYIFGYVRDMVYFWDFMLDCDVLIFLVGISLYVESLIWSFRWIWWIISISGLNK